MVIPLIIIVLFFLIPTRTFADNPTPTPTPAPQVNWTNDFTVNNEPSAIITLLQTFIHGFDSLLGGFIFYTPDPLSDPITLKDNSQIPGVTKYRNMFNDIAVPIMAIVIAVIAITKLGSDNIQELKSFVIRFLIAAVLFLTVPSVLSYSIQFNNLLVNQISSTQEFTSFLDNYLTQSQTQITNNNASSDSFGIPSFDLSLQNGILTSIGKFLVQIFLFALTFLFLLGGFIYIGFQFVIRFAALLFLGVIYPIVIPFILSEKTQGVVYTFFKIWFTFLIQQPAFVLGFAIATDIFTSILNAKGPSVGMLFFYTGFLFFLGGVNVLVGRIFGDGWTAASANIYAAAASRAVTSPIKSNFNDFAKGFMGGSISNNLGQGLRRALLGSKQKTEADDSNKYPTSPQGNGKNNGSQQSSGTTQTNDSNSSNTIPPFSTTLNRKGFQIETENQKQGVVSITGNGYKYEDKKTGLTSIYPTRLEAIQDGVPENKLQNVSLQNEQFIDLSSFNRHNPNPHSLNVMQEAKKQGKAMNYGFVNESSPPDKIKHFLELSKKRNEAYGVQGVIVQRQARKGSEPIVRMYSHKSYEKRKDI